MKKRLQKYAKSGVVLFAFSIFLLGNAANAIAQRDVIFTQAGEAIRCRILDETPVRFVFAYVKGDKIYRSEIFKNLVTSFKFNYYPDDLPNVKNLPKAKETILIGENSRNITSQSTSSKDKKMVDVSTSNKDEDDKGKTGENKTLKRNTEKKSEKLASSSDETVKTSDENKKIDRTQPETAVSPANKPAISQQNESAKSQQSATSNNSQKSNTTTSTSQTNQSSSESTTIVRKVEQKPPVETEKVTTTAATQQTTEQPATAEEKKVIQKETASTTAIEKETPTTTTETPALPTFNLRNDMKFRVGIKGGIGNRLQDRVQTGNTYDLYKEKLLRGYVLGGDAAYFINEKIGIGATYSSFTSRNQSDDIFYINELTGSEQNGAIANKNNIQFVGPNFLYRHKLDFKTFMVVGLSPGMYFYKDNGKYDDLNYTFKGKGYGAAATLGIDFLLGNDIIGRDVILSFEAGYNYGKINALNYGDNRGLVNLATPMDISRLDFTIGLRFSRFPKYLRLTSY